MAKRVKDGGLNVGSTGLLACPFCGNKELYTEDDGNGNWWVSCTQYDNIGCGSTGSEKWCEQDAIDWWNKRDS